MRRDRDASLTAFPADGYTARWRTWDADHLETPDAALGERGMDRDRRGRARSGDVRRCGCRRRGRSASSCCSAISTNPICGSAPTAPGAGARSTAPTAPTSTGAPTSTCTCTPFTHTLPIRRLGLAVGAAADVSASRSIDVETLGMSPRDQPLRTARSSSVRATRICDAGVQRRSSTSTSTASSTTSRPLPPT